MTVRWLIGLLGLAACAADSRAADESSCVVWTLDGTGVNGAGVVPEVLGAPAPATFDGVTAARFDGEDDAYVLSANPLAGAEQFTIEMLLAPEPGGLLEQRILHVQESEEHRLLIELRMLEPGRWALDTFLRDGPDHRLTLLDPARLHPAAAWRWVALRYDGTTMSHFVDGVCDGEGVVAFRPMRVGATSLGVRLNRVSWYRGLVREVRFHRTALAPDALQRR